MKTKHGFQRTSKNIKNGQMSERADVRRQISEGRYQSANCPGPFVANDRCVQFLRSFDEKGCLGGAVRRGVSIMVGFCARNAW